MQSTSHFEAYEYVSIRDDTNKLELFLVFVCTEKCGTLVLDRDNIMKQ